MRPRSVAAAIMLGVVATACGSGGGPKATPSPRPTSIGPATISYSVTGGAPTVVIFYGVKDANRKVTTTLPWNRKGTVAQGVTVTLRAHQPYSRYGYRLICTLSVTIPGHEAVVSSDSSHIVGIKAEGGPQNILYDGLCNTAQVVSLSGLPVAP